MTGMCVLLMHTATHTATAYNLQDAIVKFLITLEHTATLTATLTSTRTATHTIPDASACVARDCNGGVCAADRSCSDGYWPQVLGWRRILR